MLVNRKELLRQLESCVPGLAHGETTEQANCFVLSPGKVRTFNDEVKCEADIPLQISCAVPSRPILETLRKLTEDEVDIELEDGRLMVKCPRVRRIGINVHVDIVLNCDQVEQPSEWVDVPPVFADALAMVAEVAAKDSDQFITTCVRFTPRGLEATDAFQAIRYKVQTPMQRSALIKRASCLAVKGLGIAAMSDTQDWVHWKTYTGLVVSVRKYDEEYPDLTPFFSAESTGALKLPPSLLDSIQKASVFMADTVSGKQAVLRLAPKKMMLRGQNESGFFEEVRDIAYEGPKLSFGINPNYLQTVLKYDAPCDLTENSIRIRGDGFCWISSLEAVVV